MSVVERCPNCGTTSVTPGECEACHEAQVRYFCTNHSPGLWLDASTCPKCGARSGELAEAASTPAPAIPVRTRTPAAPRSARAPEVRGDREPPRAIASTEAPPPLYSRAGPSEATTGGWDSREGSPLDGGADLEAGLSRMPLWQKILGAAVRTRDLPTTRAATDPRPPVGLGGCLARFVLLSVFLLIALAGAVYLFGQVLIRGW